MKKVAALALALMLCLPVATLAAGKASVTQETFYVTPFLGYFAGEVFCEVTNTGDKPVKIQSGVYEFYDADGESIDSGSIYNFYPRILSPGEKGYISIQSGIKDAKEPAYINDYSVSIVGKSAKEEEVVRYAVSNIRMDAFAFYGQAFYATVTNDSAVQTGNISVVFGVYDADGALLYACRNSTSGMSLLPGSSVEVYCTIDSDILDLIETNGKAIATITAMAFAE